MERRNRNGTEWPKFESKRGPKFSKRPKRSQKGSRHQGRFKNANFTLKWDICARLTYGWVWLNYAKPSLGHLGLPKNDPWDCPWSSWLLVKPLHTYSIGCTSFGSALQWPQRLAVRGMFEWKDKNPCTEDNFPGKKISDNPRAGKGKISVKKNLHYHLEEVSRVM